MTTSANGNAPGGQARGVGAEMFAPAPRQDDHQRVEGNAIPRVMGRLLVPAGRRSLAVLVVSTCPYCPTGGPHLHRGNGGPRTAGCCGREYYVVAAPSLAGRAA